MAASSPRMGGSRSHGGSWRELSLAPFACSPELAAEASSPSPIRQQPSQLQAPSEQQVLVEASRVTLSAAAVGYARHAMLPVLQLPSLRLACSTSSSCSGSSSHPVRHGRAASWASAAGWPGAGSPEVTAATLPSPAATAVAYQLDVSAVDIGLHPSQLSMLTAAVQICEHELALLGREPQEGAGTDSESAVTSLSGTLERQQSTARTLAPAAQQQQQQQVSPLPQRPVGQPAGRRESQESVASGLAAAAAGAADAASPQHAQQGVAADADVAEAGAGGSAGGASAAPVPAAAMPQWRLEAAIGCVGVSILGATASSTCLKIEWHGLRAAYAAAGLPGQADGKPGHCRRSSLGGSSLQAPAWEAAHDVQLSWRQLALHVLEPRPAYQHPSLSPFAFAAAIVADAQRSRWGLGDAAGLCSLVSCDLSIISLGWWPCVWDPCQYVWSKSLQRHSLCRDAQGGLLGGSPTNGASPRALGGPGSIGFGPLDGTGSEVLYQRGRGGPLSVGGSARRNLTAGLGAAGACGYNETPRKLSPAVLFPLQALGHSPGFSHSCLSARAPHSLSPLRAETVASEEWHEASATLLGRTSGSSAAGGSRYFSLAESEFEDAASELEPGACTVLLWLTHVVGGLAASEFEGVPLCNELEPAVWAGCSTACAQLMTSVHLEEPSYSCGCLHANVACL